MLLNDYVSILRQLEEPVMRCFHTFLQRNLYTGYAGIRNPCSDSTQDDGCRY
jgi:hypothetical protein